MKLIVIKLAPARNTASTTNWPKLKQPPDNGSLVCRCLQNHTEASDMSTECKDEIDRDQARSSEDYRLNYKLAEACKRDTDTLCPNLCQQHQACGGQVLRCLTDKSDQISAKACRDEVFYFKKMEVTDFRNDVLLAAACRDDVDEFCSKVKPGKQPMVLRHLP